MEETELSFLTGAFSGFSIGTPSVSRNLLAPTDLQHIRMSIRLTSFSLALLSFPGQFPVASSRQQQQPHSLDGYMSDGDVAFFNANGTPKTIGATGSSALGVTSNAANCIEVSSAQFSW